MKAFFIVILLLALLSCKTQTVEHSKRASTMDSLALAEDARIRARQCYEADQLDSALALYTLATQYNPNDKHAWHGKAATLGRLERHDESMPAYAEALRIDSNYVFAIWHRACGYAKSLQKDNALADLRRAIELDSAVKQGAKEDACFDWLWDDKDFLAIVK